MKIEYNKRDAAIAQANTAVRLFFEGHEPVPVHTLAGAAATLFYDLVEAELGKGSWEAKFAADSGRTVNEFLAIARRPQNYFKHAKRDAGETLLFDTRDTEVLLFICSLNWAQLVRGLGTLSTEMSVFQLWHIATIENSALRDGLAERVGRDVDVFFPGVRTVRRQEQLNMGRAMIEEYQDRVADAVGRR